MIDKYVYALQNAAGRDGVPPAVAASIRKKSCAKGSSPIGAGEGAEQVRNGIELETESEQSMMESNNFDFVRFLLVLVPLCHLCRLLLLTPLPFRRSLFLTR